jgi:F420-0:gamma-glutamyl ligase
LQLLTQPVVAVADQVVPHQGQETGQELQEVPVVVVQGLEAVAEQVLPLKERVVGRE